MATGKIKSGLTQTLDNTGIGDSVSGNQSQNGIQIENKHLDVAVPSGSIGSAEELAAVNRIDPQREAQALHSLRNKKVVKATVKWTAGFSAAGGITALAVGVLKGAAIGSAIGLAGGPLGVVVGAILGGSAVLVGAAGLGIGAWLGKKRAAKITRDTLLIRYDPASENFNKLVKADNKKRSSLGGTVDLGHQGGGHHFLQNPNRRAPIPTNFSAADRREIKKNFSTLLNARINLGPRVTKKFLEWTAMALARFQGTKFSSAFTQHLDAMVAKLEQDGQPLDDAFLRQVMANANLCADPLYFGRNIQNPVDFDPVKDPGVEDCLKIGLASIMTAFGNKPADNLLLHRVRGELLAVALQNDLTAEQKRLVIDHVSQAISTALKQEADGAGLGAARGLSVEHYLRGSYASFVREMVAGMREIACQVIDHNTGHALDPGMHLQSLPRERPSAIDPDRVARQFTDMMDDVLRQRIRVFRENRFGTALARGLVRIHEHQFEIKSGQVETAHKDAAAAAFRQFVLLEHQGQQEMTEDRAKAEALGDALINGERELAMLKETGKFSTGEMKAIDRDFRQLLQGFLATSPKSEWKPQAIQGLLKRVTNEMAEADFHDATDLQALSTSRDYQADIKAESFWTQLLEQSTEKKASKELQKQSGDAKSAEQRFVSSLCDTLLTSQHHQAVLDFAKPGAAMTFAERFSQRLAVGLTGALDGNPKTSKELTDVYYGLMGVRGIVRSLTMVGNLMQKDSRLQDSFTGTVLPEIDKLISIGFRQAMQALAARAGISPEQVKEDFLEIDQASKAFAENGPENFDSRSDLKEMVNSKKYNKKLVPLMNEQALVTLDSLGRAQQTLFQAATHMAATTLAVNQVVEKYRNQAGGDVAGDSDGPGGLDGESSNPVPWSVYYQQQQQSAPHQVPPQSYSYASSPQSASASKSDALGHSMSSQQSGMLNDEELARAWSLLAQNGANEDVIARSMQAGFVDRNVYNSLVGKGANDLKPNEIVSSLKEIVSALKIVEIRKKSANRFGEFFSRYKASEFNIDGKLRQHDVAATGDCFYNALNEDEDLRIGAEQIRSDINGLAQKKTRGDHVFRFENTISGISESAVKRKVKKTDLHDNDENFDYGVPFYDVNGTAIQQSYLDEAVQNGYISDLASRKEDRRPYWADERYAALASARYQRPVVVFRYNSHTDRVDIHKYGVQQYKNKKPIMLTYDGISHFDAVKPA